MKKEADVINVRLENIKLKNKLKKKETQLKSKVCWNPVVDISGFNKQQIRERATGACTVVPANFVIPISAIPTTIVTVSSALRRQVGRALKHETHEILGGECTAENFFNIFFG